MLDFQKRKLSVSVGAALSLSMVGFATLPLTAIAQDDEEQIEEIKVKGCVSQVFVRGSLDGDVMRWQGDSDALITKGLLALLIQGLSGLTPAQVQAVDPAFIAATGLQTSLTPSRANGFLNILRAMQEQARQLAG